MGWLVLFLLLAGLAIVVGVRADLANSREARKHRILLDSGSGTGGDTFAAPSTIDACDSGDVSADCGDGGGD